jgi:hypothetical protein
MYDNFQNVLDNVPELSSRDLTDEQIELILQPIELQENYYQDGELDEIQARRLWLNKLSKQDLLIPSLITYILGD